MDVYRTAIPLGNNLINVPINQQTCQSRINLNRGKKQFLRHMRTRLGNDCL